MRIFWLIIALLAAATIVLAWPKADDSERRPAPAAPESAPGESVVPIAAAQPPPFPPAEESAETTSAAASETTDTSTHATSDDGNTAAESDVDDAAAALAAELRESSEARHAAEAPAAPETAAGAGPAPAAARGTIIEQADGALLIDGRHAIRGSGTAENPYHITWDLLISAADSYQPRLGQTKLPEWVDHLNGKHVKIAGYLAFPLAQMESEEVLVMLNMWDGCCIGVPPSPFDAIEVKLKKVISLATGRAPNYGTLSGVFRVDPYLQNDWLLGLYLVEQGTLDFGL